MRQRFLPHAPIAICLAATIASAPSLAATTPQPVRLRVDAKQQSLRNAKPAKRGHPLAALHVFGTIMGINGDTLALKLRSGRMISIDATTAITNNDYSYPLYVGKTVAIDGKFSSVTTFVATHVFAITTLQSLESDSSD